MADPNDKNYRTESGHAPGEVTPEGVGVLHVRMTRHKTRKHSDGSFHQGARHHFDAAEASKVSPKREV